MQNEEQINHNGSKDSNPRKTLLVVLCVVIPLLIFIGSKWFYSAYSEQSRKPTPQSVLDRFVEVHKGGLYWTSTGAVISEAEANEYAASRGSTLVKMKRAGILRPMNDANGNLIPYGDIFPGGLPEQFPE
jgi:hypothetical protein